MMKLCLQIMSLVLTLGIVELFASEITILKTPDEVRLDIDRASSWRYHEVRGSEIVRLSDGSLIHIDPLDAWKSFDPKVPFKKRLKKGESFVHATLKTLETPFLTSAQPAEDWKEIDFDDSRWLRTRLPMGMSYRSIKRVCYRAKFKVERPEAVKKVSLKGLIHGGAIFYINGIEVGRCHLAATNAEGVEFLSKDYPEDAYADKKGHLIDYHKYAAGPMSIKTFEQNVRDKTIHSHYRKRFREFNIKVLSKQLKKGVNVLSIDIHRAPAHEVMVTRTHSKYGLNLLGHRSRWWNRAGLEQFEMKVVADKDAMVSNLGPSKGVKLWQPRPWMRVMPDHRPDPLEECRNLDITAAKGGGFSRQLSLSSVEKFRIKKVSLSQLKTKAGDTFDNSSIAIRYPRLTSSKYRMAKTKAFLPNSQIAYDTLEERLPQAPDHLKANGRYGQNIYLTVEVPRQAEAGDYLGTLSIELASGERKEIGVGLKVIDWQIPDPKDFHAHMGYVQSPDSLAMRYGVPMWSEKHFTLIEKSFELLAKVATKEVTIPLVRKSHFGNEHSMLYWVADESGTMRPQFDLMDRYLAIALKHLGKVPAIIFYIGEGEYGKRIPWISQFDPQSGEWIAAKAPKWGTPEALEFWQPAFHGIRELLSNYEVSKSLVLGYHAAGGNGPLSSQECIDDLKILAPNARWSRLGHYWFPNVDKLDVGPNGQPWSRVACVGEYGVFWGSKSQKKFYAWRNPHVVTAYTRDSHTLKQFLFNHRILFESTFLTGTSQPQASHSAGNIPMMMGDAYPGLKGYGPMGGDFFEVLKVGRNKKDIVGRYDDPILKYWDPRSSWSTCMLNNGQRTSIIGDGERGPASSIHLEALRESLQESEARIYVQDIIDNPIHSGVLGKELLQRARALCDRRTDLLRQRSEYGFKLLFKFRFSTRFPFDPYEWQEHTRDLYEMAAEISAKLKEA